MATVLLRVLVSQGLVSGYLSGAPQVLELDDILLLIKKRKDICKFENDFKRQSSILGLSALSFIQSTGNAHPWHSTWSSSAARHADGWILTSPG